MSNPSNIGKNHVLMVSSALKQRILGESVARYSDTVLQTIELIINSYPNIHSVTNKFETEQPDTQPDLLLRLLDGQKVRMNLFLIKGSATIQPKNLGAKSFLNKYFGSNGLQMYFNDYFDKAYEEFLRRAVVLKENINVYERIPLLKKKVKKHFPKFEEDINPFRTAFLFSLREHCFNLLKEEYNLGASGIQNAFNELMLVDSINIITRYTSRNKCLSAEFWKSSIDSSRGIQIYKKGNDTIGIRSGEEALTLRFKFESSPASSIKLATSYEVFPAEDEIKYFNLNSMERFEGIISQHQLLRTRNKSNAIGKCNEAMVYYGILKKNPSINQVNEPGYREMLKRYSVEISKRELLDIHLASEITSKKIDDYLRKKYKVFSIESIQLVADSYLDDRLDTSDLQIIVIVDEKYIVESFSLKAISKRNAKITAKNPGVGKILGSQYFDVGSLLILVDEVKSQFGRGELNHQQCLEKVSEALGESLSVAPEEKLKKGVLSLLGSSITVLTIYSQNESLILEHDDIKDEIKVFIKSPTAIQTTLRWNGGLEELSLRVKFSASQSKGWSSLKLACEYRISNSI